MPSARGSDAAKLVLVFELWRMAWPRPICWVYSLATSTSWPRSRNCLMVCPGTTRFDRDLAPVGGRFGEARGFERALNIHPEVHHIGDELRMRQRLIRPAHDAESDMQIAFLHERGNDGVKRALAAGASTLGCSGFEREAGAAIVQQETHAFDRDPGAEQSGRCSGSSWRYCPRDRPRSDKWCRPRLAVRL